MADPTWELLGLKQDGWIATLTLSRPPVNALSRDMVDQLRAATEVLAEMDSVSVIVFRSDLPHFCAGADLKERVNLSHDAAAAAVAAVSSCLDAVAGLHQPTIAAVNGAAIGGGAELALACDLRIMAGDVRFGLTETSLGVIPGAGGTQRLPRLIGPAAAKDLIFSARTVDSSACLSLGLANRVVPEGELERAARAYAAELAANAPLALRAAKQAILEGEGLSMPAGLQAEGDAYRELIHTRDREEGLRAFLEKRPPTWKGE